MRNEFQPNLKPLNPKEEADASIMAQLALRLIELDTTHGDMNPKESVSWLKEMYQSLDDLEKKVNSLGNKKYITYLSYVNKNFPNEEYNQILREWQDLRKNTIGRAVSKIFSKRTRRNDIAPKN